MPEKNSAEDTEIIEDVWGSGDESRKKKSAPVIPKPEQRQLSSAQANNESSSLVLVTMQKEIENLKTRVISLKNREDLTKKEVDSLRKKIHAEEENILDLQEKLAEDEKSIGAYESEVQKLCDRVIQIKKLMAEFEAVV